MSEDQRVSRNPAEPDKQAPAGAQRWADYLAWVRDDMIAAVLALSPTEQRELRVPSGWSPIELLSHVLHMEQRWFVWGFLGEAVEDPWGDWSVPEPGASDDSAEPSPAARWRVADDVTADALAERLRALGHRTRAILLEHPLDTPGASGGRFGDDPPTLEWICFHVLAEYARHAGHLDVSIETQR
ncbi:MAG: DUF664 domain-containing protein [Nocardioidaceae bacterium]